jgi:hypothetical protein
MLIATAVALGANAAVLGLIFRYVSLVEGNEHLSILGTQIYPRESFLLLVVAVVALLAVSLVLAFSQYLARSSAIVAMVGFEKRCVLRAIGLSRLLPDPRAHRADEILQTKKLFHLVRSDAIHCGFAIKFIGFGIQALLMFLFALGVMFVLDAQTTMVVCGLGLIVVAAQYPSNLFAAASTAIYTSTRTEVQKGLMALLGRASALPRPRKPDALDEDVEAFFEQPAASRHMKAAENRFRAIEVSGLTMRFGGALILGGIILAFGILVLEGRIDWASLLAYLTMLRLALSSITSVFQTVTMVTRLYPDIQEYAEFVASASLAKKPLPSKKTDQAREPIEIRAAREANGPDALMLERGTRCAFMAPLAYGRDVAADFQRALGFQTDEADTDRAVVVDLAVVPPRAGDTDSSADWIDALTSALQRFYEEGTDVILIDRRAADAMQAGAWEDWCERLRDRLLIVVYAQRGRPVADLGEEILFLKDSASAGLRWLPVPKGGLSPGAADKIWHGKPAASKTTSEEEDVDLLDA